VKSTYFLRISDKGGCMVTNVPTHPSIDAAFFAVSASFSSNILLCTIDSRPFPPLSSNGHLHRNQNTLGEPIAVFHPFQQRRHFTAPSWSDRTPAALVSLRRTGVFAVDISAPKTQDAYFGTTVVSSTLSSSTATPLVFVTADAISSVTSSWLMKTRGGVAAVSMVSVI
jgi:hypothetical protein